MVIRGQQRTTHSDSARVSGRAKELLTKGFYFLKYDPKGTKPSDVWEILPEDTQQRELHFAPFPEDLCLIPILATCPPDGVVLDPFCGTGTACVVARRLERKSVGIDLSDEYLQIARKRVMTLL
jgi:DNA modification methylase